MQLSDNKFDKLPACIHKLESLYKFEVQLLLFDFVSKIVTDPTTNSSMAIRSKSKS